MHRLRVHFLFIVLILLALVVTLVLSNKIGKPLEKLESKIYRKISGKKPQYIKYDQSGLPTVVYEGSVGEHATVIMTAQEALNYYKNKTDSVSKSKFFVCIEWLKANSSILNDSSIIFYVNFNWPGFQMEKPWRSAMSQGRAMQAFIKAYELTRDTLYLNLARRSMNTLYTEVKDGGVTYIDSTGYWYEEYADDNVPQSRVLNGMIIVLQALSDFYNTTNDPGALCLFKNGVSAVKSSLHLYDSNGHSNYDVLGKPASPWYHNFHIELLDFLYIKTHDPIFNEYKQKWLLYKEPSFLIALVHRPTRIGVFALFSLFVINITVFLGIYYLLKKLKGLKS
jgi:hypothetical protein